MIKYLNILFLQLIIIALTSFNINAQELLNETSMEPKAEKVSIEVANAYLKKCQNNFPRHFTPRAHSNYCNCSAATIRGEMTKEEFSRIQSEKLYKSGDKTYDKYIKKVVVPCMTIATPDISHVACLEERGHNPRITSILSFCNCVSDLMSLHVEKHGAASIITNMSSNPKVYKNPIYALLDTNQYLIAKYDAQRKCTKRAKMTSTQSPIIYER